MNTQEAENLINSSFLSDEGKQELKETLEIRGVGLLFFDVFNKFLIEEAKKRKTRYKQLKGKLENLVSDIDDKTTAEKRDIEIRMEKRLGKALPKEIEKISDAWNVYYKELDLLGKKYERGLKNIITIISKEIGVKE